MIFGALWTRFWLTQSLLEACRGSWTPFSLQQKLVGGLYRFLESIFPTAICVEGLQRFVESVFTAVELFFFNCSRSPPLQLMQARRYGLRDCVHAYYAHFLNPAQWKSAAAPGSRVSNLDFPSPRKWRMLEANLLGDKRHGVSSHFICRQETVVNGRNWGLGCLIIW